MAKIIVRFGLAVIMVGALLVTAVSLGQQPYNADESNNLVIRRELLDHMKRFGVHLEEALAAYDLGLIDAANIFGVHLSDYVVLDIADRASLTLAECVRSLGWVYDLDGIDGPRWIGEIVDERHRVELPNVPGCVGGEEWPLRCLLLLMRFQYRKSSPTISGLKRRTVVSRSVYIAHIGV